MFTNRSLGASLPSCDFSLPVSAGFLMFMICFSFAFQGTPLEMSPNRHRSQRPHSLEMQGGKQGRERAWPVHLEGDLRVPSGDLGEWVEKQSGGDLRPRLREAACPLGRQEVRGTKSEQATAFLGSRGEPESRYEPWKA